MSTLPSVIGLEKYSYQHLQGIMFVRLNKLACELKLSHAEYHLAGVLIGYWNKNLNKAYPSVRQLAKTARMSSSTVLKALDKLKELGLIVIVKTPGKRQNYYINTQKFLFNDSNTDVTTVETKSVTPCSYTKQKRIKLNKNKLDHSKTNFKLVSDTNTYKNKKIKSEATQPKINEMVKKKYWIHKPTGKKLQVLPDIGNHLLIKYFREDNLVSFLDLNLCDYLDNFKPLE